MRPWYNRVASSLYLRCVLYVLKILHLSGTSIITDILEKNTAKTKERFHFTTILFHLCKQYNQSNGIKIGILT